MKKVDINISSAGFPSQFVSDSKKATDEFGFKSDRPFNMSGSKRTGAAAGSTINGRISIG